MVDTGEAEMEAMEAVFSHMFQFLPQSEKSWPEKKCFGIPSWPD